jgi:urocanate hydratase
LGRVISFAAQRSEHEKPKSAAAIELVLCAEAASKQLSSVATMAEAPELFEKGLKLPPDNVAARAGVATTDIYEVVNGYYPSGNSSAANALSRRCHAPRYRAPARGCVESTRRATTRARQIADAIVAASLMSQRATLSGSLSELAILAPLVLVAHQV